MLNVMLVLALGSLVLCSWVSAQPTGPEGPVGAWLLWILPLGLVSAVLVMAIAGGAFDAILPSRLACFVLAAGVLAALLGALVGSLARKGGIGGVLILIAPYLIVAGCFLVAQKPGVVPAGFAKAGVAATLGSAALAGWILLGVLFVQYLRGQSERQREEALAEQARDDERAAYDRAQYAQVPADAGFAQLAPFLWSPVLQDEARARVVALADLDGELAACLAMRCADDAVSYIAHIHPAPPATFAAPYAALLERELETWRSTLEHDEHAAKWEPNLSKYFVAAEKIQRSGGDLRPQLQAWHEVLRRVRGLESLAAEVGRLAH